MLNYPQKKNVLSLQIHKPSPKPSVPEEDELGGTGDELFYLAGLIICSKN
jgi:hypothetical protein